MRVLIVDDDASMRGLLSSLLTNRGYEVVAELADGSRIMEEIAAKTPDIVCLDYQMPGRDGLEILHEINEKTPWIDVLFMTASDDLSVEQRAADAGAAGFVRKPFGQAQIVKEIDQVWEARQKATAANEKAGSKDDFSVTPAAPLDQAKQASANRPFNPRSVVIVDDNGAIRFLLKGLLTELGLNVVQLVGNGEEAVKAAKVHQPGVLCLDVEMPIMSGLEALPLISEVSPRTSVVMVTGSATREFVTKAAALGAKGYIVKPIRPAYIEAFVKELLK
ncbi:MAG: response regulator [Azonexus sp.]|nr:response regulator [Azonexus sp.]